MAILHVLARSGLETNVALLFAAVVLAIGLIGAIALLDTVQWSEDRRTAYTALVALGLMITPILVLLVGRIAILPLAVGSLAVTAAFLGIVKPLGALRIVG